MRARSIKTNVARFLEKQGIRYELVAYEVDEHDLGARHVAAQLGECVEQVFKTIVFRGDRTGCLVGVIPADGEVDLKKLAKASSNKKCEPLPLKELQPTTGYIRGGCSPIGMKKRLPTYIHASVHAFPYIYVSAGVRGLQLKISPSDLIVLTGAHVADIITEEMHKTDNQLIIN